jgi:TonB family protein
MKGLGQVGAGLGRVGTGQGAVGDGSGIVGGKTQVVLRPGTGGSGVEMGSIDGAPYEKAILDRRDEFRLCYERELEAGKESLAGMISVSWVVNSTGRAQDARVVRASLEDSKVQGCILNLVRSIAFPAPAGGGTVGVTFPFKFSPPGKAVR